MSGPLGYEAWKAAQKKPAEPETPLPYDQWKALQGAPADDHRTVQFSPDNLIRQAANGVTFGQFDKLSGGADALMRKIGGDKRPIGELYQAARDASREKADAYSQENPGTALLSQIAGALASGRFLPGVSVASDARLSGRVANAAATGAAYGGAASALSADGDVGDRAWAGVKGAAVGGAVGGTLQGVGGMVARGARSIVASAPEAERGVVRDALSKVVGDGRVTDEEGAARLLGTLNRAGVTTADVRSWHTKAAPADMLMEGIGPRGVRRAGTVHRAGYSNDIEPTITERARNEASLARQAVSSRGGEALDDTQFQTLKLKEAQDAADPLYAASLDHATVTDPKLLDLLRRPTPAGAYREAEKHAADQGRTLPTIPSMMARAEPEPVGGAVQRRPNAPVHTDDELMGMSLDELRKQRRNIPVERMTDRELALEKHYLEMLHGQDQATAGAHYDNPAFMAASESPTLEEARGRLQDAGIHDRANWNQQAFQAGAAQRRVEGRTPKLQEVTSATEARAAAAKAPPAVSDADYRLPERGGELPTLPARDVQLLKLKLDDRIAALERQEGGSVSSERRNLLTLQGEVDNLLHEHAPGYDAAKAAYKKPMDERDAFALGQQSHGTMEPADVPRLLGDPNAPFVARGVNNKILEQLNHIPDGSLGAIANPARVLTGNARNDARLAVAMQGDPQKIGDITKISKEIDNRMATRQRVLGGAPTAERVSDDAPEISLGETVKAVRHPGRVALELVGRAANGVDRAVRGRQLDAEGRILLAGGPNQMPREQGVSLLERVAEEMQRRAASRPRVAGTLGGRLGLQSQR